MWDDWGAGETQVARPWARTSRLGRTVAALLTSVAVIFSASHSRRGKMLMRKSGLNSVSTSSSTASRKWRGKAVGADLQALTAQVRKLTVRIFMVFCVSAWGIRL